MSENVTPTPNPEIKKNAAPPDTGENPEPTAPAETPKPTAAQHKERLSGVHLRLQPGAPLVLSLPLWGRSYAGKVIGGEAFEYLIVRVVLPRVLLSHLAPGAIMTTQVQMGGMRYRFQSTLLNRTAHPGPLLFLAYPTILERVVLRHATRLKVSLPGKIQGGFGHHEVVVLDLARTGCSFTARADLHDHLREAKPGDRMLITCDLVLTDGCGQSLTAMMILRRVDEAHGHITMGGQFTDLSEENGKLLRDYLVHMKDILGDGQ